MFWFEKRLCKKSIIKFYQPALSRQGVVPYTGNWVFVVGKWGGPAYPALSRAMTGEGGLTAWLLLLWYIVCFSCLELNLYGLIKVPLQHPSLALHVGGLHPPQVNNQGRQIDLGQIKEGGILMKMRIRQHQTWSWGVQVVFPMCLPHMWQSSDFLVLERSSLHRKFFIERNWHF